LVQNSLEISEEIFEKIYDDDHGGTTDGHQVISKSFLTLWVMIS
jgi:hypothetical protein